MRMRNVAIATCWYKIKKWIKKWHIFYFISRNENVLFLVNYINSALVNYSESD